MPVRLPSLAVDPKHLDIQYHTLFLIVTRGHLVQPKLFQLKGYMEGYGPPHRARWRKRWMNWPLNALSYPFNQKSCEFMFPILGFYEKSYWRKAAPQLGEEGKPQIGSNPSCYRWRIWGPERERALPTHRWSVAEHSIPSGAVVRHHSC